MQTRSNRDLLPALLAVLGGGAFFAPGLSPQAEAQGYTRYLTGNAGDATVDLTDGGGLVLAGGGTDVDDAMTWFRGRVNGGDIVILRASGSDGYNDYLYGNRYLTGPRPDSVESLVFSNRAAASDPAILASIANAEGIFFAGGNQADYDDFWRGTPLADAVNQRAAEGAVVGGTSAGLAILGSTAYVAQGRSLRSSRALNNPYHPDLTLEHDFLALPQMDGVLTDSHFANRGREGRLITMLARAADDTDFDTFAYPGGFRGIGVNDESAVVVEPDGTATVHTRSTDDPVEDPRGVHLFTLTEPASVLQNNTPLAIGGVAALELQDGDSFDFSTFTAANGVGRAYSYSAANGRLTEGDPILAVVAALPGDFDGSGAVEQADLDAVLTGWGAPRGGDWSNATGFATDTIDQEELDAVLTNWGSSAAPSFDGFAVPEPHAAAGLIGLAMLLRRFPPASKP